MYPPSSGLINLDAEAASGILGSVSIACWVVVFSPQIIENFRRGSAQGLSIIFIFAWLVGDLFNILGAVFQGVLPTMIILAVYYTLADAVLLAQCFYYEGFTLRDKVTDPHRRNTGDGPTEQTALLQGSGPSAGTASIVDADNRPTSAAAYDRRSSFGSFRERLLSVDAIHLSRTVSLVSDPKPGEEPRPALPQSTFQSILFNLVIVVLVIAAGIFGWWLGNGSRSGDKKSKREDPLEFNALGQVFGYTCAVLYLASRLPQLLLNYHRKSTEGISMLFFTFACIGNLAYSLSIFAYAPTCYRPKHCQPGEAGSLYGKYIAVNASWLLGSVGTLLLDASVFVQYFMYRDYEDESESDEEVEPPAVDRATRVTRASQNRRAGISFMDD